MPKVPQFAGQSSSAEICKHIDADTGFVILLGYDGSSRAYATEHGSVKQGPVAIPADLLGEGVIQIFSYESSPGCITIKVGGETVTMCK